jgi:hypothetical protein
LAWSGLERARITLLEGALALGQLAVLSRNTENLTYLNYVWIINSSKLALLTLLLLVLLHTLLSSTLLLALLHGSLLVTLLGSALLTLLHTLLALLILLSSILLALLLSSTLLALLLSSTLLLALLYCSLLVTLLGSALLALLHTLLVLLLASLLEGSWLVASGSIRRVSDLLVGADASKEAVGYITKRIALLNDISLSTSA